MFGSFNLKSSYSMLESLIPLKELIEKAKDNDYDFIALTDNFLHGTIELFNYAKKYNIKPILGMSFKVYEPNEDLFLLYVKNEEGYKNLLKLSYLKSKGEKLSLDEILKYQKGLIVVTGGYKSLIDQTLLYGNELEVNNYLKKYNELFDDFYIGIATNYNIQIKQSVPFLYKLAESNNYNVLLIHETNYLLKTDKSTYEALIKINNINNEVSEFSSFKMMEKDELISFFALYPKVLKDQEQLINDINFKLKKIKYEMPHFKTKNNISSKKYLYTLAHKGLSIRLKNDGITNYKPYVERLNHELDVISRMDFDNYFLIVYDFVKYAKQNNILVGPGRGSAAGSLVSYTLGITDIDPLKYNLMFERFLNPERTTMPDIDLDFPDNKRGLVINYVKEKYGINHISSITTFSSFKLRSSIRDIARVLNFPLERVNGIIKAIDNNKVDESDFEVVKIINTASKIEGLYRQTGTHAAGIILAHNNLFESIPMQVGAFDFAQSQYDMNTLEDLGLIKIDFLGIRNLTIITDVLDKLKKKNININLNKIPLDDKKTYKLLSSGNTTGLFQLESAGMRKVLQKLKPTEFEDLIATIALYRPGPMANIDIYIARKNGEKFSYLHEDLKEILKPTYGIIIYQEQIMQIAQKFAGYNLFEADMLRIGVSKKDRSILEKEKAKFVSSAVKNGYDEKLAIKIYNYILEFANYGFNRSHSVSYSLVAYQMAYLKANYYLEFMSVLLNSVIGNETQTRSYIEEVRKNNVEVILPNINESINEYIIKDNKLLMPLTQVKSIGFKQYEDIINERKTNGIFKDFNNLKERLIKIINEKQLRALISAGALDLFKYNRNTMLVNSSLESAEFAHFIKDFIIKEEKDLSFVEYQKLEYEALGINLKYNLYMVIKKNQLLKNYLAVSEVTKKVANATYDVCGVITNTTKITNKNNEPMMFIDFSDGNDDISIVVFSDEYEEANKLPLNKLLCLNVRKTTYNNKDSYQFNQIIKVK